MHAVEREDKKAPWKNSDAIGTIKTMSQVDALGIKVEVAPNANQSIAFQSYGRSFPNDIHSIREGSCTPEARYNPHVL